MMDFLIQKVYAQGFPVDGSTAGNFPSEPTANSTAFETLLGKILTNIVNPVIYLLMALATIYFLYGVMIFIKNADNAEKRSEGYQSMIWGIVGLFIMLSAKGIIRIILSTMGL